MARTSEGVQFGTPQRGKEAAARPIRGRRCEYPGCPTVLSTYNSATTCWFHTRPSYGRPPSRD
jgi:hypothetical protein